MIHGIQVSVAVATRRYATASGAHRCSADVVIDQRVVRHFRQHRRNRELERDDRQQQCQHVRNSDTCILDIHQEHQRRQQREQVHEGDDIPEVVPAQTPLKFIDTVRHSFTARMDYV